MSLDGNHVQIPNATIYKSNIVNYTSNPLRREEFDVGIGYEDSVSAAQDLLRDLLARHPAVLPEPAPLILVDHLGSSAVILRISFWIDTVAHDQLKVKSSVIRQTKQALEDGGFSMPDEAREVIFPNGIPLRMVDGEFEPGQLATGDEPPVSLDAVEAAVLTQEPAYSVAEGNLSNEDNEIRAQARKAPSPEGQQNLLATDLHQTDSE